MIQQLNELQKLYDDFFQKMRVDTQTGRMPDLGIRFTGYPFIGRNYYTAKQKILFVSLDVGMDECRHDNTFHSFEDRRNISGREA